MAAVTNVLALPPGNTFETALGKMLSLGKLPDLGLTWLYRFFSPANLFANGEQGVWYDPSDLTTLFQDAAGTTPVTAVEQPVGLMLDKSKGLVLGSELVTNGTFDTDINGWAVGANMSAIWNAGKAQITRTAAGLDVSSAFEQNFTTVAGKTYAVTFTFSGTGAGAAFGVFNGTSAIVGPSAVGTGTFTRYFVALSSSTQVNFWCDTGQTVLLDNISVRELPGNHAYQTTATSRPVLSARVNLLTFSEQFDDAAWTKSNSFVQTNLLKYSEQFDNGYWEKADVTVLANQVIAPNGTLTSDKLIATTDNDVHRLFVLGLGAAGAYTLSCYMKAGEYTFGIIRNAGVNTFFNLATGAIGTSGAGNTATMTSVGNGWYRCSVTRTLTGASWMVIAVASADNTETFAGDGTSGLYIWGAQLVQGTTPGDYKATYAAAAAVGYPDIYGQPFAQKLVAAATTSNHLCAIGGAALVAGIPFTASFYAKAGEYSFAQVTLGGNAGNAYANFDLSTGTVASVGNSPIATSIEAIGNGWYRCALVSAPLSTASSGPNISVLDSDLNSRSPSYAGDGTSGIYIWGASLVPADQASLPYQRVNTATDYDTTNFPLYLRCDGIDDGMVTSTITPGTDKAQVFAGVRKLSDAVGFGIIYELGIAGVSGSGRFNLAAPANGNTATYFYGSGGTVFPLSSSSATASGYPAPTTNILCGISEINTDTMILRVNGTQGASSNADQGTGNYLAYPLYLFRRGGTSLPFNGHFYGGIIRFGDNLPIETIEQTEALMAAKTGVTL